MTEMIFHMQTGKAFSVLSPLDSDESMAQFEGTVKTVPSGCSSMFIKAGRCAVNLQMIEWIEWRPLKTPKPRSRAKKKAAEANP